MTAPHDGISLAQAIALLEALYLQGWGELTFKCQGHVCVHVFFGQSLKLRDQVDTVLESLYYKKSAVMTTGGGRDTVDKPALPPLDDKVSD